MAELKYSTAENEPGGELVLRLTINRQGKVKDVQIVSTSLKNARWQQEIVEQLRKWRFPATQGSEEGKVTFSLVLGAG
jgi:TonB family protein